MVLLENFPNVYCPTCRRVEPARLDVSRLTLTVLKADAYIDHDSLDIVCKECRSVIASLHADNPKQPLGGRFGSPQKIGHD